MPKQTPKKLVLFVSKLRNVKKGVFGANLFRLGIRKHVDNSPAFATLVLLTLAFGLLSTFLFTGKTMAANNSTVNFQARLETAAGAIVPDGYYNVEFKLYNVSSGGSALWTEDWTYSNGNAYCTTANGFYASGDCRLQVVNGYLTVPLGELSAFSSSINWNQPLYLTMNIGGTTSSGSITWDGEMSPRISLTATPYSFQANQLANSVSSYQELLQFTGSPTGNVTISLPDTTGTVCLSTSTNCGSISGSSNAFINGGNAFGSTATLGTTDNYNLQLETHGSTALTIDTSQNVGIGTTSPQSKLDVAGGVAIGSYAGTNAAPSNGLIVSGSVGFGTDSPSSSSALTLANGGWISSVDAAGTGYINLFSLNSNNEIQAGAAINVDGGINLPTDAGQVTFSDLPIDSTPTSGTPESYTFRVGSSNALTVYGESNGSGGVQNVRVAVGNLISPAYTLDVAGSINASTNIYVNGSAVCTAATGCAPTTGSGSYIQNTTSSSLQTGASFAIQPASGTVGGYIKANGADILDLENSSGVAVATFGDTGSVLFKPSTNSTTAFQIQPASSSTPVLNVDTTNGRIGINTSSPAYALDVNGAIESNTGVYVNGTEVCTPSDCVPASGSTNYIWNTTTVQNGANAFIRSSATGSPTAILQGANGQTADILDVQSWNGSSATNLLNVTAGGDVGIGTSGTPSALLSVGGSTGNFTVATSGNVATSGTYNTNTFTSSTLAFGAASAATVESASGQNLNVYAQGATTLTLDSTGAGTVDVGNTNATAINVGSSSTTVNIKGGTNNIQSTGSSAFQVQTAGGSTTVLNVNTSTNTVNVGVSGSGGVFNNYGATLNTPDTLSNFTSSGSIGTAASTVDIYTTFVIPQTTSSITLSLPSPTNTTSGRSIYIINTGTASFNISSPAVTLNAGAAASLVWEYNGSSGAWVSTAVSTGVSLIGSLDGGTANSNGAYISGNTLYLQSAGTSYPGLVNTTTQSFAGNKTFTGTAAIQPAGGSTTALQVLNGSNNIMQVDSTNDQVIIGNSGNTITLSASSGYTAAGNARHAKKIVLTAEYAGAVLSSTGCSSDIGTMTAGYDGTQHENYYQWTTAQSSNQCYNIVVQVPIPSDFSSWNGSDPLTVDVKTSDTTNGTVVATLLDTSNTAVTNWNTCALTPTAANTWVTSGAGGTNAPAACGISSGTWTAGGVATLTLQIQAPNGGTTKVGNISLTYLSAF